MKKIVYVLALGMVLGFASAVFAQAAKPGQNVMTETVIISPETGTMTMTMINYRSGNDYRMENYKGQGSKKTLQSLTIASGGFIYVLDPVQKSGMKAALNNPMSGQKDPGKPQETSWAKVMEEKKAKGLDVVRREKEKWGGREYEVWRETKESKAYVDYYLDKNQMVKRVVSYDSKGQLQQDLRIIKYEVLKALPAGALDVPKGYKIEDMSHKNPGAAGGGGSKP